MNPFEDPIIFEVIGPSEGPTVSFNVGVWPNGVGEGLALSDAAFELIEPSLTEAFPAWTSGHRYGVVELPRQNAIKLARELAGQEPSQETAREVFQRLADWLRVHSDEGARIGIHGY